jgi:hypothetical protein
MENPTVANIRTNPIRLEKKSKFYEKFENAAKEKYGVSMDEFTRFCPVQLEFEIKGIQTVHAHVLHTIAIDDIRGHRLGFKLTSDLSSSEKTFDYAVPSREPLAVEEFYQLSIGNIAIDFNLDSKECDDVLLMLDVKNKSNKRIPVLSGDIKYMKMDEGKKKKQTTEKEGPQKEEKMNDQKRTDQKRTDQKNTPMAAKLLDSFDKYIEIGFLDPGNAVRIYNIKLMSGTGRSDAKNQLATLSSMNHLDIPTRKREEICAEFASASTLSRYVPHSASIVSWHHKISIIVKSVRFGEEKTAKRVIIKSCDRIISELRNYMKQIEYATFDKEDNGYVMTIKLRNGIQSIGSMITADMHHVYTVIDAICRHKTVDDYVKLSIRVADHATGAKLFTDTLNRNVKIFEEIKKQFI